MVEAAQPARGALGVHARTGAVLGLGLRGRVPGLRLSLHLGGSAAQPSSPHVLTRSTFTSTGTRSW